MRILARSICALVLLMTPVMLRADVERDYRAESGWNITGRVNDINDRGRLIELYDRSDRHYTIVTSDAKVYEGYNEKRLRDIGKGDTIRVYGRERDDRVVEARTIFKVKRDGDDWYGDRQASVYTAGIIKRISRDDSEFELVVDRVTEKVHFTRQTRFYTTANRIVDVDYVRNGDSVTVSGRRSGSRDIVATAVYVGEHARSYNAFRPRHLDARVTDDASFYSRTIKVELIGRGDRRPSEEFTIEVSKDVRITRGRDGISVHDIHKGDVISADGRWDGSRFIPQRIQVNDGRRNPDDEWTDYDLRGRITRIYGHERQFQVDNRTVYADSAKITQNGRSRRFEDLRRGDEVAISGNESGRSVQAIRIEILRSGKDD